MPDRLLEYAEGRRRRHPRRCLGAAFGGVVAVASCVAGWRFPFRLPAKVLEWTGYDVSLADSLGYRYSYLTPALLFSIGGAAAMMMMRSCWTKREVVLVAACGAANVVGLLRTLHAMSIDPAFPDGWF